MFFGFLSIDIGGDKDGFGGDSIVFMRVLVVGCVGF